MTGVSTILRKQLSNMSGKKMLSRAIEGQYVILRGVGVERAWPYVPCLLCFSPNILLVGNGRGQVWEEEAGSLPVIMVFGRTLEWAWRHIMGRSRNKQHIGFSNKKTQVEEETQVQP